MRRAPTQPFPLLFFAATVLFIASPSPAQRAATRPASQPASQPATDPSADAPDDDMLWPEPDAPAVLTTAADIRSLTPAQAAAGRPVRLRGTVTYIGSYPPMVFVQDPTGGVAVIGQRQLFVPDGKGGFVAVDVKDLRDPKEREKRQQFRYGATVQVEGVTARGGEVAYVTSPDTNALRIQVLPAGRLPARPAPAHPATLPQLASSALHGDVVEVEAVVRSVRSVHLTPNAPAVLLTLAQGDARATAMFIAQSSRTITPDDYVGAVVRVRGVFNAAAPSRWPDVVTNRLLVRTARDLTIQTPATPAQSMPVSPIRSLASDEVIDMPARCRIQGVVTLALPGSGMFVQDSTGGVWVEDRPPSPADDDPARTTPPVRGGACVDLVAFPGRRGWSTVLADPAWQVTGHAPPPDAPLVTAGQALASEMDGRLVRINALVLSQARIAGHATLVLQSDERVFLARLADATVPPPAVSEGSWVRVTGVCVQTPLEEGWAAATRPASADFSAGPSRAATGPPSFHLLLPSDESVQVISPPGWWTPERVLVVCGVLAAVALASIAWVVALRRRVTRQTHTIREHLASRTLYEERVRIARDLHDSLEQDLLGITMQLNATEKLLTQPERARQSLHLAAAMVRRSQAETHRAVWDLREQRTGHGDLTAAIREAVTGLATAREASGGNGKGTANDQTHHPPSPGTPGEGRGEGSSHEGPQVNVRETGDPYPLPPKIENHLLRVALEAVTNAVKHAHATKIDVELTFSPEHVEVRVADDGRGFDADRPPPPSTGHFGLFGMRERAEKLGGHLTLKSKPAGGGTEVRLVVPTNPATPSGSPAPHSLQTAV